MKPTLIELDALLRDLHIGVLLQDSEARILFCNPQALALLGLSEHQLLGKTSFDPDWNVISDDGRPLPGKTHPVPQAIQTGKPVRGVVMGVYRPRLQDRVWLLVDAVPRVSASGELTVLCTFSDVTTKHEAEASLRASQSRYRQFVDGALEGIVHVDEHGTIEFVNQRMAELLGYGRDEMIGRSMYDFIEPNTGAQAIEIIRRRRDGHAEQFDFRLRRKDGQGLWTIVSASPTYDADGRFAGSMAMVSDVTERRRAEEATRQSEERYRTLVNATSAIVWTARGDGGAPDEAPFWTTFTGQQFEDYQDGGWIDAVHPDDRERSMANWKHAIDQGVPLETCYRLRRHDGVYRHVIVRGIPIRAADGSLREWVGTITDVHERFQAEQALLALEKDARDLRDELSRTNYLAMLGFVTGSIAHELKQPLTAIRTNAQSARRMLASGRDASEMSAALDAIVAETSRATEVIERTRAFLKTGAAERAFFALNVALEEVVRALARAAADRGIEVKADLAPGLPEILGDRVQVQQLAMNLLLNAFDAAQPFEQDRRTVRLQTHATPGSVVLSVSDAGTGVTEEQSGRIFLPLYTTKPGGMGLGLAICESIVRAHGGQISADTNADGGLTMKVAFALTPSGAEPV
jgi:PAS domain S-box-containing protein